MEKTANVCIDHVTVYTKSLDALTNVMAPLGFYARDQKHYMFRNNYLEGYEVKPTDPPYSFFTSPAGLHSFILWADDADAAIKRLGDAGYEFLYPNMDFTRMAEHGQETGEATFRGTYLKSEVLPVGEVAVVEHKNPEFIYPPHPDTNPNTAYSMTRMYLAVPDEDVPAVAARFDEACALVRGGGSPHCGMNELVVAGAETYKEKLGLEVNPARSACVGIRFAVEDMDKMTAFARESGLPYKTLACGALCVDALEPLNLFLLFEKE